MQDRRHFLKQASALTIGFGPLRPDPEGVFDLPEGFSYRILSRHGEEMGYGFPVPHRPDGMAAFPEPNGTPLLVRNPEVDADAPFEEGPFRQDARAPARRMSEADLYDARRRGYGGLGGTATVVYDTGQQAVRRQFVSLAGTIRNCADGPTP